MKLVFAIAVAAGLVMSASCMHQGTVKTEENAMDIKDLQSCDFYGEISVTDAKNFKQTFYAGELKDESTRDIIIDLIKQGEKAHKLVLDEGCELIEDADGFKITAKNKKGNEYTLETGYVSKREGDIIPVVFLKNGENISCYTDDNNYTYKYDDFEQKHTGFSDKLCFYTAYDLKKDEFKTGEKTYTPNTEKTKIVLLRHYTNSAWYHADEGSFVDMNGNIYTFSYSSENFDPSPYSDLMTELNKIYNDQSTKPVGAYPDTEAFKILASYADKIDPNAEITYEQMACDAGQNTTYLITENGRQAFVHSTGDSDETSDDKYADMAHTILERIG